MTKQLFRLFTSALFITLFTTILASAQSTQCATPNTNYGYNNNGYNNTNYNNGYGYNNGYNYNDYQPKRTISERIQNQRARVSDGLRDGSLTPQEANRLQARMTELQRDLDRNSRNGFISNSAVNHIQAELDSISRSIYDARHNGNYNGNYNNGYNGNQGYNGYNRPANYGYGNYNPNPKGANNNYYNPQWRNR